MRIFKGGFMEIKKDCLCFAEYYFPNDETRKKEVSLFFINRASYYGPFKGWSIYIHAFCLCTCCCCFSFFYILILFFHKNSLSISTLPEE